jgi:hypothetical protein
MLKFMNIHEIWQMSTGAATSGKGGDITVAVGTGYTGSGGDVLVAAGESSAFNGGAASFKGGDGVGNSGTVCWLGGHQPPLEGTPQCHLVHRPVQALGPFILMTPDSTGGGTTSGALTMSTGDEASGA